MIKMNYSEIEELKEYFHFLNVKMENLNVKMEDLEKKLKHQENEQEEKIDWADTFIVIHGNAQNRGLTASFHPNEQHAIETMQDHNSNKFYKSLKIINLKDLIK